MQQEILGNQQVETEPKRRAKSMNKPDMERETQMASKDMKK